MCAMLGGQLCYPKTRGYEIQIKVAIDQKNIFDFKLECK